MTDKEIKGPAGFQGRSPLEEGKERLRQYEKSRLRLQKYFMIFLGVLFVISSAIGWWIGGELFKF